ncbi:uncharacterized protein LOC111627327 [Centruroides sculpturatus]|uniref:uncharacterized protein LOC111627327 n=1 Tax=Centruroides sculpturatus TaxID=218467 RepID=UPI000C6ED736|nr:uncharacterized protein LOC111627327 [Centruroides sculpturatus]
MNPSIILTVSILFFFLLTIPDYGNAIKCWVCRSDTDPRCADPFDNTSVPINDCDIATLDHLPGLKATMCRKMRQKVNGHWRFYRSCAFLGTPGEGTGDENYCLMRTGTYNIFVEYCTCNSKNGCNTSPKSVSISIGMIISSLILVMFISNILK